MIFPVLLDFERPAVRVVPIVRIARVESAHSNKKSLSMIRELLNQITRSQEISAQTQEAVSKQYEEEAIIQQKFDKQISRLSMTLEERGKKLTVAASVKLKNG